MYIHTVQHIDKHMYMCTIHVYVHVHATLSVNAYELFMRATKPTHIGKTLTIHDLELHVHV